MNKTKIPLTERAAIRMSKPEQKALRQIAKQRSFKNMSDFIRHCYQTELANAGMWPPKQKEQNTNAA